MASPLEDPTATRALHAIRSTLTGVSSATLHLAGIRQEVLDALVSEGWITCHEGQGLAPDDPKSGGVQNDLYLITTAGMLEAAKRPRV